MENEKYWGKPDMEMKRAIVEKLEKDREGNERYLIEKLEKIVPCMKDIDEKGIYENEHHCYRMRTIATELNIMQLTDLPKQWGIDPIRHVCNASRNELIHYYVDEYFERIREFAGQNTEEHEIKTNGKLAYDVMNAMHILDMDEEMKSLQPLKRDASERAIYISRDSRKDIVMLETDFMMEDCKDSEHVNEFMRPFVEYAGRFIGVPVYIVPGDGNFIIVCNKRESGFNFHYRNGSMRIEVPERAEYDGNVPVRMVFQGGFAEDEVDVYKHYLLIK